MNNAIITPEYGPRIRFGSVLTAADLPPDPLREDDLCTRCMKCVEACPAGALDGRDYPEGRTDKAACTENSADLARRRISPCGICIAVCPVGEDRQHYAPAGGEEPRYRRAREHVQRYGGL